MSRQIKIRSSTESYNSFLPNGSKDLYVCANAQITKGVTGAPSTIQQCFERFPEIETIAKNLGVELTKTVGSEKIYNFWTGPGTGAVGYDKLKPIDLGLSDTSTECLQIESQLGSDWLGCLWGSPEISFSCTCPYVNSKFEAYIKHRQTVATFWNTSRFVPVQRMEFLDEFNYGNQITITVGGDFSLSLGDVVQIDVTAASGYPYMSSPSNLNNLYWIVEIKHVVNNGGTHETKLKLARMAVTSV
jgi:hypothetical protein